MRSSTLLTATLCCAMLLAGRATARDFGQDAEARLGPAHQWIVKEKFRASYSYAAPPELYERAMQIGLNAVISRLDIACDPANETGGAAKFCADLIQPSSERAKQVGLHWFYMLNPGGSSLIVSEGFKDNPRRLNNGKQFAPTDEIYWKRTIEGRFLRAARMLQGDQYQIDGFMFDPEFYALGGATPGGVDYGDFALGRFVEAQRLTFDFKSLSISERRAWIGRKELADELEQFQFDAIKALAVQTRQRIHELHPDALFGTLLSYDSLWFRAVAAGMSTPDKPFIMLPERTYAGEYSEAFLNFQDHVRQGIGVPILFVPGVMLTSYASNVTTQADDERMGVLPANVYHRAIRSQGYWVYYLSRLDVEVTADLFTTLTTSVNPELDRYLAARPEEYVSAFKPAPIPAAMPQHVQATLLEARAWQPVPQEAWPANPPSPTAHSLRNLHTYVAVVEAGQTLEFDVQHGQVGSYLSPVTVVAIRPDFSMVPFAPIPPGKARNIRIEIDRPGAWVIVVSSGSNAAIVRCASPQTVLFYDQVAVQGDFVWAWNNSSAVRRYFFYVPEGTQAFTFVPSSSARETATFRMFGPDGALLVEDVALDGSPTHRIDASELAGKVCWIETSDVAEDAFFKLVDIPNIYAASPGQLMAPRR
jgi:hypothetical protein